MQRYQSMAAANGALATTSQGNNDVELEPVATFQKSLIPAEQATISAARDQEHATNVLRLIHERRRRIALRNQADAARAALLQEKVCVLQPAARPSGLLRLLSCASCAYCLSRCIVPSERLQDLRQCQPGHLFSTHSCHWSFALTSRSCGAGSRESEANQTGTDGRGRNEHLVQRRGCLHQTRHFFCAAERRRAAASKRTGDTGTERSTECACDRVPGRASTL